MQKVDCLVRLGGDLGNTVPRKDVTAAELALLREIHGADAVVEIRPTGDVEDFSVIEERERLRAMYGRSMSAEDKERNAFETLYPGANPRLFTRVDEIGIPEACFAAERVKPASDKKSGKPSAVPAGGSVLD